jgi:hypothetical protein
MLPPVVDGPEMVVVIFSESYSIRLTSICAGQMMQWHEAVEIKHLPKSWPAQSRFYSNWHESA